MALIGLISHDAGAAMSLEAALSEAGHSVRLIDLQVADGASLGAPDLFVVDMDGGEDALDNVRRLCEGLPTALTPVLVAGSPETAGALAGACAYGASGYLRKPFSTVETVPDTERALTASL